MDLLGEHTSDDIDDLLKTYDYQLAQINAAAKTPDAVAWAATPDGLQWMKDLATLNANYKTARASADSFFSRHMAPESAYQNLATVFKPIGDLDRRLRTHPAVAKVAPTYSKNPQPVAVDEQLRVYKAADSAVKKMEQVADEVQKKGQNKALLIGAGVGLGGALVIALKKLLG